MKPPPFAYDAPDSLDEALSLLGQHGPDAKALAGGQSLVPLLNFRLVRPARLVDLNGVAELDFLREDEGTLRIGAMTRSRTLERSATVAAGWPLLREAVRFSGHPQIRNRGTVGGSCAHADPAAELPCALLALDARLRLRSPAGARLLPADDFFVSVFTTALEPGELIAEIEVPRPPTGSGFAFREQASVRGDFALGGVAVLLTLDEAGVVERAAVSLLGAAVRPIRAHAAETALVGARVDERVAPEAAELAVRDLEPAETPRAGRAYRIGLLRELARTALLDANARAS